MNDNRPSAARTHITTVFTGEKEQVKKLEALSAGTSCRGEGTIRCKRESVSAACTRAWAFSASSALGDQSSVGSAQERLLKRTRRGRGALLAVK